MIIDQNSWKRYFLSIKSNWITPRFFIALQCILFHFYTVLLLSSRSSKIRMQQRSALFVIKNIQNSVETPTLWTQDRKMQIAPPPPLSTRGTSWNQQRCCGLKAYGAFTSPLLSPPHSVSRVTTKDLNIRYSESQPKNTHAHICASGSTVAQQLYMCDL